MTAITPKDRYRRLDLLGRGGMGEVLLADDLLLKRKVAIKVVHRSSLANPRAEKLLRREAKAAAALDNPFICKVYEVGEDEGRVFIAMEYILGETLRQRMTRGPIPVRDVISLAREVADGLDEADRKRVIHRDLKPSNIIITPQGHVKIMDFGLAKRLPGDESVGESSAGTPDGMVVGTREYMSPEQLRGKPLESSSDLFALGLILYEMTAGYHPFRKAAAIDTQFAILSEKAKDLGDACPGAPDALCDLVASLLEKVASDRPRIGQVRERLADITDSVRVDANDRTVATSASMEAFVARKPRLVLTFGLLLIAAIAGLSLWIGLRPEPTMPQARMATLVTWPSNEERASLSPDAKSVSFISNRDGVKDIWLMDLSGGEPRRITNAPGNLTTQTFSEDGKEIAYTIESETQKLFQTVRIDGGPPTRSLSLPNETRIRRMIRWVGNEVFMETQNVDLIKLSLPEGRISPVSTIPKFPGRPGSFDISRDGRWAAFGSWNDDGSSSIVALALGEQPRPVTRPGFKDQAPFFSDSFGRGRLFFESDRSGQEDLWMIERPGRDPRQITFGSNREFIESVSADGTVVVFSEVLEGASIFAYDPRSRSHAQFTAENMRDVTPTLSSGDRIAFARTALAARFPTQLTSIQIGEIRGGRIQDERMAVRDGFGPLLSPDGHWLAFMTRQSPTFPAHLNLLDVESGHARDLGVRPTASTGFMDFPWSFSRRDSTWSKQGTLYFSLQSQGDVTAIVRVKPGAEVETLAALGPGQGIRDLIVGPDESTLFWVQIKGKEPGGAVMQWSQGKATPLLSAKQGGLVLLGLFQQGLLVAHQERLDGPVRLLSVLGGTSREILQFRAVPSSWRYIPRLKAVAFSRRDARDVENIYLKDLATGAETAVTTNGIQGIAFSPISEAGSGLLVFSQQLRNKDLGIIRIDRP